MIVPFLSPLAALLPATLAHVDYPTVSLAAVVGIILGVAVTVLILKNRANSAINRS